MKACLRIGAVFCLQFATAAQPAQPQLLPGHVPAAVAHLTAVGRLEGSRELQLAIGLPLRNKAELTNLLQAIYNPASPDYRHYLTPAQFAERFGPTEQDYRAVTEFAVANGLKVAATHPNRTLLDVAGTVSSIEKALHVTMRTYAHPREKREFYAPDAEPSLDLAAPVLHISGLDNYLLPHPMNLRKLPGGGAMGLLPATGSGPGGAYMGNDFRAAYVPGLALTGTGQSVGLLEFDGYYPSDITNYAGLAGLPAVPLKNVLLDGFNGVPGGGNIEVALDIDMAVCMAPGLSSVIVYEGEEPDDVLNRMATDDLANQLSASWTYPIDAETEQIFQQFGAQGQSFFNAAGDGDAYVGPVSPPSDDPNLTSVGGTTLTTSGPGGAWVSETVWNWDVEFGADYDGEGTGGGISATYPIPFWQTNLSMATNQGSTAYRNVPDVAMVADNVFLVADDGLTGEVGGTSCATPLWAAFTALVNEQAAASGRPPLGFLNPAVYALGQSANYTNGFHDITNGNNTWSESPSNFYAVAGYDLCTGWGTPGGSNLVNLLAPPDSLQISPLGGFSSSGAVGGPLTPPSQSYVLTNVGNAALNWAADATVPWLKVSPNGGGLTPGGAAAAVLVSLNAAASNLFLGNYGATVWFTNLTDGDVQNRAVSLRIIKPPGITAEPASLALIGGTTAAFTAVAAGGVPLTCQWQFNGTSLADGGRISGSQTTLAGEGNLYGSVVSTLTISNLAASDGGTYVLVASNAAGMAASLNAVLTVIPSAPVIVQQPASQTVLVGATAQLAVVAEGAAPFTYQWRLNQASLTDGGAISGSGTPTLTLNGVSSASIGTYTVVVSNSLGAAASTGAVLTVTVAAPGAASVQNGGFETGSFSSWNESGNFVDCSVSGSSPAVYSGHYGALLGSVGSLGYLSQSLPTAAGQLYLLSLWLDSPDGISPNEFLVTWNGTTLFDQTNLDAISWTNLQFYVAATGSNTLLEFGFRDDQSFLGLDDIQAAPLVSADGPPIIATQPASQVALQGGAATFSVLAAGELPLSYQWQFDGASLASATNATLTLANVTNSQAGTYSVVVSNSLNWTTSSNALLTVLTGTAALITFDDLPGAGSAVPMGYHNLTWSNFYYLNAPAYGVPSGYIAGMISPSNVAYNGSGTPAAMSAPGPFDLLSAYLTAAWNDNLRVEVQGYTGPALSYDNIYTLSATTPTLIPFNYVGVTEVQFISSGGTQHPGYSENGLEFVLDNMTVVPPAPTPMSVLYSFNGPDGGFASSGLALGADGNFYGTTEYGGTQGDGTVFRMTTNGTLATLFCFGNTNGSSPSGALIQGADGNFYGTTEYGGTHGDGTVFRMTTNGALTTLASFNYSVTGGYPSSALLQGADGNFYGTTAEGGIYYDGTVFKMTPNGALTALLSFDGTNGSYPYGALVQEADGNFYGATSEGGGTTGSSYGTVFRLTVYGALTTLHTFDYYDGGSPRAGLAQGADGNLYGTTSEGGPNGYGTVFKMTTNGALTTLYSFDDSDGYSPCAALIQGADGNFYGTTEFGGSYFNGSEVLAANGTVFKISTNGALTTLLCLEGANGDSPQGALVQGADGNFYGTTTYGGVGFNGSSDSGNGIVFRVGAAPATAPPAIVAQPASQIVPAGGAAVFSVNAGG
ncbi:MAG: choice-of-anchor tandem repeat GloVer-containing protein, partial [Verrucomicrobiota bacterium]